MSTSEDLLRASHSIIFTLGSLWDASRNIGEHHKHRLGQLISDAEKLKVMIEQLMEELEGSNCSSAVKRLAQGVLPFGEAT